MENILTGRVVGRLLLAIQDGPDLDAAPDIVAPKGELIFTAAAPYVPYPTAETPFTLLRSEIRAVLDSEGYICTPSPTDPNQPGVRGILLWATDSPGAAVQNWTWSVRFVLKDPQGRALPPMVPEANFALPAGQTIDITKVARVPGSTGLGIEQAQALVIVASNQATEAATQARLAQESSESARVAASGAQLAAEEAQVAAERAAAPTRAEINAAVNEDGEVRTSLWMLARSVFASDEPTRADLVATIRSEISSWWTNTLDGLVKKFVQRNEYLVDVRDFGAAGNGTTDDTAAVQAAVDAIGARGGGILYFPPGDYYLHNQVWLVDNMTITGSGATLVKKTGAYSYACFVASSGETKGYGAGPSNITAHGLKFKGEFKTATKAGRSLCAFAMHHSEDVLVYDCEFIETSWGGHRFDLQGCRRVTIRDCVFHGFDKNSETRLWYNEDIQLDNSTRGGGSFAEPGTQCFDGLPCTDILVDGNRWLEYVGPDGTLHPAANPIGTHSAVADYYHKRIRFTNNYVGPGLSDLTSYVNGRLHFLVWDDALIAGNTFDGGGVEMAAIRGYHASRSFAVEDIDRTDNSSTELPVPLMNKNITIRDNTFRNFKSTTNSGVGVVHFTDMTDNKGAYHQRIKVLDNRFEHNKTLPVEDNNSQNLIWLSSCEAFEIRGNVGQQQRRGVWVLRSRRGRVSGNNFRDSSNNVIGVDYCSEIEVENNEITGLTGSPCIAISATDAGRVKGNVIRSTSTAITGVRFLSASTRGVADSNLVMTEGSGQIDQAVHVMGGSTAALVKDTVVMGNVRTPVLAVTGSAIQNEAGTVVIP